jgi:hypothetical protein
MENTIMPKISSRSRECAEAIGQRRVFETYGALWTTTDVVGGHHAWLNHDEAARWYADRPNITYAVYSYNTPIAWVTQDGTVHKVAQKFSVTTSKHQGKLYLLGA